MPNLKLYYGTVPSWRGEVCRLALHLGKVPFEDIRWKSHEEKNAFLASDKAPFGQVPILEVDGKVVAQTGAIARYCGKLGGFYPRNDDFAAARIDEIIDTTTDLTLVSERALKMKTEAAKKELATVTLPKYCRALEKILVDNGATGFYVGSSMTIADIAMWRFWGRLIEGTVDGLPKDLLESYPQVPFEDIRMTPEEKEAIKASGKAPFGKFPILEVDGKVVAQTGGIARYCGKLGGFYPRNDDFAAAKIDEIIDTTTDLTVMAGLKNAVDKDAAIKQLVSVTLPKYWKALEKILVDNGSTGFYVGSSMTIADIAMWRLWGRLIEGNVLGVPKDFLESYPQMLRNFKATDAHPEISAWKEKYYGKA